MTLSIERGLLQNIFRNLNLDNIHETAAIVVGPPIMMKFAVAESFKAGNEGRTNLDITGKKNVLWTW